MKVAIDLEKMKITHVHQSADILSGLVYLECSALKHVLFDGTENRSFLSSLTTLELNLLYRNTTGSDFPSRADDLSRREVLAAIVEAMQARSVNAEELDAQIESVFDQLETKDMPQFRYVFGSRVPKIDDNGLFQVQMAPANDADFDRAAQLAPQRRDVRSAPLPPAPPAPRAPRPAVPSNSGQGGSRPAIFAHADMRWEEAGKPMHKETVLTLRKKWMVELEEKGIKKTTSSTALGDWMKQRIV